MTDIAQQILDLTGVSGEMLVEFLERVDNFVLDYNKELEDRGYEPSVLLGLAWALHDAEERLIQSCKDYITPLGKVFDLEV